MSAHPATHVCVLFLSLSSAPLWAAMDVDGRVVNSVSNEPVPAAPVTLTCESDSNGKRKTCKDLDGRTSEEGVFHFALIFPGRYLLKATGAPGLVATKLSEMEFVFDYRHYHAISPSVLKLTPESTITGKITDETGQPKADVAVEALRVMSNGSLSQVRSVSKAVSNEQGVYVLRSLFPGNYYVATALPFRDKNDPSHPYLFFAPDAVGLDQAALTHVDPGQNYPGLDLHLRPVGLFHLQGKAQMETVNSVSTDKPQLHLDARDSGGVTVPAREIFLNPDGGFETDVLPGSYTFRLTGAQAAQPSKDATKTPPVVVHLLAEQDIEVNGKDVLGLVLLIPPPITVNGHAVLEGTTDTVLGSGRVFMHSLDPSSIGGAQDSAIQPDGTFQFTNCDPVNYAFRLLPPNGTYVKSILFNQQDITNQAIDLSHGVGGDLTVTVRQGAASIVANISNPPPAPSDGGGEAKTIFDLVVIPDQWDARGVIPIRHVGSTDGNATLRNLPPGHYSLIATLSLESRLWNTPSFVREMQARGMSVDLVENDQKQVSIPYLSLEEVNQIETALGID